MSTHRVIWDLSPLLNSDDDPTAEKELAKIKENSYAFINKWKDRNDYLEDPVILKEALDEYEKWEATSSVHGNVGYYFWLRSHQEQENPTVKAKLNKISDLSTKIINDIDFFTHKLSKLDEKKQKAFLENNVLHEYKHFLKGLFDSAKYLLTQPEEKILNLKSQTSYSNWVRLTSELIASEQAEVYDDTSKKTNKTFSEIISLCDSPNKKIRESAGQAINSILVKHSKVAEHEINSILKDKQITDEIRKTKRPDELRHVSDDIETEVVDALLESVVDRFDLSKKYYELLSNIHGVSEFEYFEKTLSISETEKSFSYEESVDLINTVFTGLDTEFAEIFENMVRNGQIDVYPKKGKSGGAFCAHLLKSQPTYVLLNHTNKLRDVLTLAHEMGHAINNELMKKSQNALNFDTTLAVAEVASTFMEDFVLQKLLNKVSDQERLELMMGKLKDDVSTIFRQVACYKFEQELHLAFREKGYLSKEEIGDMFVKHMSAYLGPRVKTKNSAENWWVYWSHIRNYFYVYSYASGLLISKSLQNKVKEDASFVKKIKEFMSAGTSASPKEIFLNIGIDISKQAFWSQGLSEIETLLTETEQLAKKLRKI